MINASIVLYNHSWVELEHLIQTLQNSERVHKIYLIDNSPTPLSEFKRDGVCYFYTGKNLGYGGGHNIALRKSLQNDVDYHLVLNPDIVMPAGVLEELEDFMNAHPEVGHLMPKVIYPDGETQYLCKLLPRPSDLFMRRFLPESCARKAKHRFEMRESEYNEIMEVPYLSGCFMFLRTDALRKVGLFDERFFMYPEDIDLTRRIHQHYKTLFYPKTTVVHKHERDSYKSLSMLFIHTINLMRYFNKWGWLIDNEREQINKRITSLILKK